jgi:hypothetical protein
MQFSKRSKNKNWPGGEIGRHAILRGWCFLACRFESGPGHKMKYLILISFSIMFLSCKERNSIRVEKKVVVDSAWHEKNPNGVPPDIEGKYKVLVSGNKLTTQNLMKKGDTITFYYYK